MPRTERFRLFLDARCAKFVADAEALLRAVSRSQRRPSHGPRGPDAVLWVHSQPCRPYSLSTGREEARGRIRPEPWQQQLTDIAPWNFLRGCIRSDGCVFINRTGPYGYLSYDFANHSADILDLFVSTSSSLGLRPRRYAKQVPLYRRKDAARLVEHVGPKR